MVMLEESRTLHVTGPPPYVSLFLSCTLCATLNQKHVSATLNLEEPPLWHRLKH